MKKFSVWVGGTETNDHTQVRLNWLKKICEELKINHYICKKNKLWETLMF